MIWKMVQTMAEYLIPTYETISNEKKRKISEMFTSSILNAFTEEDFVDVCKIMSRVIERLEQQEEGANDE